MKNSGKCHKCVTRRESVVGLNKLGLHSGTGTDFDGQSCLSTDPEQGPETAVTASLYLLPGLCVISPATHFQATDEGEQLHCRDQPFAVRRLRPYTSLFQSLDLCFPLGYSGVEACPLP